jgi:hypothetical protein
MKTGNTSYVPSKKTLAKMGLIDDQKGIMRRFLAEQDNWRSHLNHTKTFITDCITSEHRRSIAILGSGWLLDVPVPLLAEKYDEVYFYDLNHPSIIIHKYRKQGNFRFIEMDLTGGLIEQLFQIVNRKIKPQPAELISLLDFQSTSLPYQSEYFVSINLLSQIDTLIVDYVKQEMNIPLEIENVLRQKIQQQHINLLKSNSSCLVSDIEEISLNNDLEVIASKPLIYTELPDGNPLNEWIWKFDTKMTYHEHYMTYFKVKAVKL